MLINFLKILLTNFIKKKYKYSNIKKIILDIKQIIEQIGIDSNKITLQYHYYKYVYAGNIKKFLYKNIIYLILLNYKNFILFQIISKLLIKIDK